MTQYRPVIAVKKPVTVEAFRWEDDNAQALVDWVNHNAVGQRAEKHPHEELIILGDGVDTVKPGDWVIRDQWNDFYPLPHSVYQTVYASPIQ